MLFSVSQYAQASIDFSVYKLSYQKTVPSKTDKKIGKALRRHFIDKDGVDFHFSKGVINDLARVIVQRKLLGKKKVHFLRKESGLYWYSLPTYPTKFSFSVGRIDIAFKKNEANKTIEIAGVEDFYDFNSKKKKGRPIVFELLTRAVGQIIYHNKGTPFRMYYRAKEM